jgi:hypothetical protein
MQRTLQQKRKMPSVSPTASFSQNLSLILLLAMDVDQKSSKTGSIKNGRVQKRRHKSSRKASIVFPKYKDKHLNKTKKQKIY